MELQTFTSFQFCTNRVRCALNMEILDLLNEESVSGARSGRASLQIQREVLLRMLEKVIRSLKYDSNIFFVHKHISESAVALSM